MFKQLLAEKTSHVAWLGIWPSGGLRLVTDKKKKNKPRVNLEPRSAHGRAVN